VTKTTGQTAAEDLMFPPAPTTPYLIAIVSIIGITVLTIGALVIFQPEQRDGITQIIAFVTPVVMGFVALVYGMMNMHKDLNSRLSQLIMAKVAEASAQGRIDERAGVHEPTTPEIATAKALGTPPTLTQVPQTQVPKTSDPIKVEITKLPPEITEGKKP
jgi:hypothetical protein